MRKQTPPEQTKSDSNERGNAVGVEPGRHHRRIPLARRLIVGGAAALVALGSAGAAASALVGTGGAERMSPEERLAEGIVAEAIAAESDWDSVEAMTSILPVRSQPQGVGSTDAKTEKQETGPVVDTGASPVDGIDATQMANAVVIIQEGIDRGLSERAWAVALATAMQEAKLYNAANPVVPESFNHDWEVEYSDHDSIGLFQQRPSMGWGSVAEIMDPATSAGKFYGTLEGISGWEDMSIAAAAQAVQVSAFPDYYAQWEDLAWNIIDEAVR